MEYTKERRTEAAHKAWEKRRKTQLGFDKSQLKITNGKIFYKDQCISEGADPLWHPSMMPAPAYGHQVINPVQGHVHCTDAQHR